MDTTDLPTCDRCVMRSSVNPDTGVITSRHEPTCPTFDHQEATDA